MTKEKQDELSKEELLAWFDDLACGEESIDMWTLEESKQANQQIRKLIEDYDVMETYKKDWEHPKVSKEFVKNLAQKFISITETWRKNYIKEWIYEIKQAFKKAGIEVEE